MPFFFNILNKATKSGQEGLARSISDAPPTNYVVKIQPFSLLQKNAIKKYESGEFQSGGYKWKLVMYPKGNKSCNVKEHLSFYLAIADTSSLSPGSELHVVFRLFLFDQKKDKYFTVQDTRRFHRFKVECGFDEFIRLKRFNNVSNGYLSGDTCVIGADVFVKESIGKRECFSLLKNASSVQHVWKIKMFSELESECYGSQEFKTGDQKWSIKLFPNGVGDGAGTHLAIYLKRISPASKICATFTLRIRDQVKGMHKVLTANRRWFTGSPTYVGWSRSILLSDLKQTSNGFLVNDVCVLEAEVTVLGVTKEL